VNRIAGIAIASSLALSGLATEVATGGADDAHRAQTQGTCPPPSGPLTESVHCPGQNKLSAKSLQRFGRRGTVSALVVCDPPGTLGNPAGTDPTTGQVVSPERRYEFCEFAGTASVRVGGKLLRSRQWAGGCRRFFQRVSGGPLEMTSVVCSRPSERGAPLRITAAIEFAASKARRIRQALAKGKRLRARITMYAKLGGASAVKPHSLSVRLKP
jgi:hypothetical protein